MYFIMAVMALNAWRFHEEMVERDGRLDGCWIKNHLRGTMEGVLVTSNGCWTFVLFHGQHDVSLQFTHTNRPWPADDRLWCTRPSLGIASIVLCLKALNLGWGFSFG